MAVKLYREQNRVKNGYCARGVILGLAAHGFSPETADKNLERTVRLFLAPFQRQGTLWDEALALGLEPIDDGDETHVILEG